jgi:60 kDa SS-A/Ro ribonucleoprotein
MRTDWDRLDRFLVLGCEGNTYYTADHGFEPSVVSRCLASDGLRTLHRIVDISRTGRAPKNDPAIFSLAMAAKLGDERTRRAAYLALPIVCRTGSHLMAFAEHAQGFGGWGRGMRKAVAAWFNNREPADLARQLATHRSSVGWSQRDLLRLAHPRGATASHEHLFAWVATGALSDAARADAALALIIAIDELRVTANASGCAALVREHGIPRECVPTAWLSHPEVWDALRTTLPISAVLAELGTMTRVGLLLPGARATADVVKLLTQHARLPHPIAVLAALVTYRSGRAWQPVPAIVEALETAFHRSFATVAATDKRTLIALDISSSMDRGAVANVADLTPRIASVAMSLVTAATEAAHGSVAFTAGGSGITQLSIAATQRLAEALAEVDRFPTGNTDCAKLISWANQNRIEVDTFVVYTDTETRTGLVHPTTALRDYRNARGIPAKLVVVGMTSTGFSIADPEDAGMLDVVGFDLSTPPVIADFARA